MCHACCTVLPWWGDDSWLLQLPQLFKYKTIKKLDSVHVCVSPSPVAMSGIWQILSSSPGVNSSFQ